MVYCLIINIFCFIRLNNNLKNISRKTTFENYYRHNPRFKKYKIDIGQIEPIKITSNPKFWTAEDVYKYVTNDLFCKDIGLKLFNEVNNTE